MCDPQWQQLLAISTNKACCFLWIWKLANEAVQSTAKPLTFQLVFDRVRQLRCQLAQCHPVFRQWYDICYFPRTELLTHQYWSVPDLLAEQLLPNECNLPGHWKAGCPMQSFQTLVALITIKISSKVFYSFKRRVCYQLLGLLLF